MSGKDTTIDQKGVQTAKVLQALVSGEEKDIIHEQNHVPNASPVGITDMKTFLKMAEDSGLTLVKKEEMDYLKETQTQQQALINKLMLEQSNEAITKTKTKFTKVITQADIDCEKSIRSQPRVSIPVTIQRTSEGESMEYKRPAMNPDGSYKKTKDNQVVMENYIPVSINGINFDVPIGIERGKGSMPSVIAQNLPVSVAMVISEARKQPFVLPDGTTYMPWSLHGMEQGMLNPIGADGSIVQSDLIPDKYRG